MDEKTCNAVPFAVYESAMTRAERNFKRMWVLIILLLALFVGTNAAWIWYESQFQIVEETYQEVTQESESGSNTFVGGDIYGETNGQDQND